MAQADLVVANQSGAAFRSDLNGQLLALGTLQSGASAPSVTYSYMLWADTTAGLLKIRDAANAAWVTVGTLGSTNLGLATLASPTFTGTVTIPAGASISGFAPLASPTLTGTPAAPTATAGTNTTQLATTAFVLANNVPAGAVDFFAMNTAPTGYLKANGAAISRTTYATLFSAIGTTYGVGDGSTTFTLPDLRGEFLRSWADGRAVDTGRTFGSFQDQAYLSHAHGVNDPGHNHNFLVQTGPAGVNYADNYAAGLASIAGPVNYIMPTVGTGITIQSNGGSETRPRNIALLACIKF